MARKPYNHRPAEVKAQIMALEALGKKVTAVKYHPDGTFRLMTADYQSPSLDDLDRELKEFEARHGQN
ncbi:hypothetical protein ACRQ5Q_39475 [Bradyrhizobium sp. PMVTL-01]|uniref:hypothetical protein n=1 Tax=Bradyrhizobium sp. PMVTL-01 TaxID=3434999 RepID=UPI003F6EEBF5